MYFVEVDSAWKTATTYLDFNNHIAYSLLARLSEALFGRSEWALRLPPVVLGLATIPALWGVARRQVGPIGALVAALLLTVSPTHVLWSVSARGYSGLILFALLSSVCFLQLLREPSRRLAVGFVVASVASIYFHLYGAMVTVAQVVLLGWLYLSSRGEAASPKGDGPPIRLLVVCFGAMVAWSTLLYAPVLPRLFHNLRGSSGPFRPSLPWDVVHELSGDGPLLLSALALLLALLGLFWVWRSDELFSSYAIVLFVVPIGIASLVHPSDLYPRFYVYLLPQYLVLCAAGLAGLGRRAARRPAVVRATLQGGAALVLAGVVWIWLEAARHGVPEEGFRAATRALLADAGPSTTLCAIGGGADLFQYYADRPIVVPESMNHFMRLAREARETRCAYRQTAWERRYHTDIGRFLAERGTGATYANVTVWYYQR